MRQRRAGRTREEVWRQKEAVDEWIKSEKEVRGRGEVWIERWSRQDDQSSGN